MLQAARVSILVCMLRDVFLVCVRSLVRQVSRACRMALWQDCTPLHLHGRIFALQKGLSKAALPLAAVLAGPLCDVSFISLRTRTCKRHGLCISFTAFYQLTSDACMRVVALAVGVLRLSVCGNVDYGACRLQRLPWRRVVALPIRLALGSVWALGVGRRCSLSYLGWRTPQSQY